MRNLAAQVIEHKQIKTTTAKAKELRGYVDRLITYAKKGSVHHRRLAFKFLQNKEAVHSLFEELASVYETRNGGYSRIIKLGNRKGDGAAVSIFQLVGFETSKESAKAEKEAKKKGKDKKAKKETKAEEQATASKVKEEAKETAPVQSASEKEAREVKKTDETLQNAAETETKQAEEKGKTPEEKPDNEDRK